MPFGLPDKITYSCTALAGTNKTGKLKPDADGYYQVVVGGLNAFNSASNYYPLGPAKTLFESSSSLMRRIQNGNCKGEMGHPKPVPGMSKRDYIQRILQIEETRVCCHFRKVWLEEQGVKDAEGRPIVAIMAEVKPTGPMGEALRESLENPHENVCFSIRSLTSDRMAPAGYVEKNLKTIVTWDVVTEPGISAAHKYNAPSLESLEEAVVVPEHLMAIEAERARHGVACEDIGIGDIRRDLGWDVLPSPTDALPASARW